MHSRSLRAGLLLLLAAALPAQAEPCRAESGPHTTALVELYTSEGCDSCPPADRWLSGLEGRGYTRDRVVPIALHVDYWDYIGWKDPYARAAFGARQRKLGQVMRGKVVYTPQVLVQGEDFRRWYTGAFDQAVTRINGRPARARLSLALGGLSEGVFDVEATAELQDAAKRADAALYLASYENKLVSSVAAGENRGKNLPHDYVVFEWVGPLSFPPEGRLAVRQRLPLLPKAIRAHSGVVAFIQNRSTSEVLQALMLPACGGGPR